MSNDCIKKAGRRQSLGIYIHVPFCKSRCVYCDFISSVDDESQRQKYVEYLQRQIYMTGKEYARRYTVDTVYIGGGTPTLLDTKQFKDIKESVFSNFHCNVKEFTVEANPCTIDSDKLSALRDCEVSRLSLGIQSFDDNLLKMLGRRHTSQQAKSAVELAKKFGFDVSIDAMIGLPNQSMLDIKNFIDVADSLGVEHISVYMLSVEEGTALKRLIQRGVLIPKTDDEIADFYEYACGRLSDSGFERYEISNFCKGGKVSLHNLRYWNCADYLGLGMGAHSLTGGERWRCANSFDCFYNSIDSGKYRFDVEKLSQEDKESEYIMLNFRLSRGINLAQYQKKFKCDFLSKFSNAIEKNKNYLEITSQAISIKRQYLQLMNAIVIDFI